MTALAMLKIGAKALTGLAQVNGSDLARFFAN
jgi:hypothetical protein